MKELELMHQHTCRKNEKKEKILELMCKHVCRRTDLIGQKMHEGARIFTCHLCEKKNCANIHFCSLLKNATHAGWKITMCNFFCRLEVFSTGCTHQILCMQAILALVLRVCVEFCLACGQRALAMKNHTGLIVF